MDLNRVDDAVAALETIAVHLGSLVEVLESVRWHDSVDAQHGIRTYEMGDNGRRR